MESSKRPRQAVATAASEPSQPPVKRAASATIPVLIAGAAGDAGKKKVYEDRFVLANDLFAVFDGHGGDQVSDYLARHFSSVFASERSKNTPIKAALTAAFRTLDADILEAVDDDSGSCAVVCCADAGTFWVANVGDCRVRRRFTLLGFNGMIGVAGFCSFRNLHIGLDTLAVLARKPAPDADSYRAIPLSKDHMPIYAAESQRIRQAGGFVQDGRVNGILEVSRAFGDRTLKRSGVVATPYICHFQFRPETDSFIVLACDGLWKVMEAQSVVDFVVERLNDEPNDETAAPKNGGDNRARRIARQLLTHVVVDKYGKDNVTIIIVLFDLT